MSVTIQSVRDRILTPGNFGVTFRHGGVGGAANYWDGLTDVWAAYQPKGAASLAASYTDLSGNGNDAGVGVAPDWDAVNGWKFNGSTHYLTTTFVPQNDQSQTMIVQFTNGVPALVRYMCGSFGGTDSRFHLGLTTSGGNRRQYGHGSFTTAATGSNAGNMCVSGSDGYYNGADEVNIANGAFTDPLSVYIGCRHRPTGADDFQAAYIQAFVLCSSTQTAGQIATAAAAMAAL
jgi:hypothetical protein